MHECQNFLCAWAKEAIKYDRKARGNVTTVEAPSAAAEEEIGKEGPVFKGSIYPTEER